MPSKKYLDQTGLAHFWDKITDYVGDASKVMIVNITYNETDDIYESDKTVSEIKSAKNNGYAIFAVYDGNVYTLTRSTNSRAIFDANILSVGVDDLVIAEGYTIIIYAENNEVAIEQSVNTNIPLAATSTEAPLMDGTTSVGESFSYARADHVHPSDTSKANVSDVLTKTNTTSYTPSADYHPATKKYVDDSIVQSNWNENDSTSNAYVQNRPFYFDQFYNTKVVDNISFTVQAGGSEYKLSSRAQYAELYIGGIATITYNGTDYQSNVYWSDFDEYYYISLEDISSGLGLRLKNDGIYIYSLFETRSGTISVTLPYATLTVNENYRLLFDKNYIGEVPVVYNWNTLENGQILTYDSANRAWKNATIPTGVTYTLSMTNNVITLTGSDGSTSSATLPVYSGEVDAVWEGGNY